MKLMESLSYSKNIKYLMDKIFAAIILILTLPIFIFVGLILKIKGEDIFFLQERIGQLEKPFKIFKFTTMPKGSEKLGDITTTKDARPFKFGMFLRKSKLNEIPQVINILLGEMSFVGPRPLLVKQAAMYSEEIRKKIYSMRPGITGSGSLYFNKEDELLSKVDDPYKYYSEVIIPKKAELEVWYFTNWSNLVDLKILLLTAKVLVFGGKTLLYDEHALRQ